MVNLFGMEQEESENENQNRELQNQTFQGIRLPTLIRAMRQVASELSTNEQRLFIICLVGGLFTLVLNPITDYLTYGRLHWWHAVLSSFPIVFPIFGGLFGIREMRRLSKQIDDTIPYSSNV